MKTSKKGKKKLLFVRIGKTGKVLIFNAGASAILMSYTEVQVYESDKAIAIQGTLQPSAYHISQERGRIRKTLSNKQLVDFVCKKFNCESGCQLPVWTGGQDGVLFFGKMQPDGQANYTLDDTYQSVKVKYGRRIGDWSYIHDNWIEFTRELREAIPPRLSAYRCGEAVVLLKDAQGELIMTPRRQKGTPMLVSHALADYLRKIYGGKEKGMRLLAAQLPDGVALANTQDKLDALDLARLSSIALDESKKRFITRGNVRKADFYLSAFARDILNNPKGLAVYAKDDFLAVTSEDTGALQIKRHGYASAFFCKAFAQLFAQRWPTAKRIYLLKHGSLWLLWPCVVQPKNLPPASKFKKLTVAIDAGQHYVEAELKSNSMEWGDHSERRIISSGTSNLRGLVVAQKRDSRTSAVP